jgi:putative oxidoreductase
MSSLRPLLATSRSIPLFVVRVALGAVMIPHGAQKAFGAFGGPGLDATMRSFAELGIPYALGLCAIAAELLGGVALVLGLLTRVAAFGIGTVMVVAVWQVHLRNGFFMNWTGQQAGEGYEYHVLATSMALALVLGGAGAPSVDRFLAVRD